MWAAWGGVVGAKLRMLLRHNPDIYDDFEGYSPAYYEYQHGWVDRSVVIANYQKWWFAEKNRGE